MESTSYPSTLKSQVRFYQEQADGWDELPANRADLEAILALGLALFEQIQKVDQVVATALRARRHSVTSEIAGEVASIYQWWYRPCERLLRKIKTLRDEGVRIDRADEFIRACQLARIPAFHLQQWIDRQSA